MNIFTITVFIVFFTSLKCLDAIHLSDIPTDVLNHIGDYLTEDRAHFEKRIEKHTQGGGSNPLPGPRTGITFSAESLLAHYELPLPPTLGWHTLSSSLTPSPDSIIKTITENDVIISKKLVWSVEGEDYIKLFSFSSDFSKLLVATYPSSTDAEKIPTLYLLDVQKKRPLIKISFPFLKDFDLSSIAVTVDAQNIALIWKEYTAPYLMIVPLPVNKKIIDMPHKRLLYHKIVSSDFIQNGSIIGVREFDTYSQQIISTIKTDIVIKPLFQEYFHHKRVCNTKIAPPEKNPTNPLVSQT